jgi:predicted Rossmann fold nucleotide-binding protein DprA/Smf involved in DNA uptake
MDPREILDAFEKNQFEILDWVPTERQNKIAEKYKKCDSEKIQSLLERLSIQIILKTDPNYPTKMLGSTQSPFILYARGNLQEFPIMISVV